MISTDLTNARRWFSHKLASGSQFVARGDPKTN